MKTQRFFPGIILIGFGLYFFLEKTNFEIFSDFFTWPTLLCIVGLAFLGEAYIGKNGEAILPGVILFGFGVHFHVVHKLEIWPDHIGTFILIIALGLILRARETKNGMFQGLLFLTISILALFYDKITSMLGLLESSVPASERFWPFILVAIGLYMMLKNKPQKRK